MKRIPLTQGKFALVDDEDFDYLNQWKWYFNKGYAVRGANPKFLMHREVDKTPSGFDTDHINRDTLDNRKSNLRTATRSQNLMNTVKQPHNTSGIKGVFWHKRIKKWQVCIGYKSKQIHVGYFQHKDEARAAYEATAKKLYGDFALNGGGL